MPFPSCEVFGPFVLDASAIINLLGTGRAQDFLSLLKTPVLVEEVALREVTRHPIRGADHSAELSALRSAGLLLPQRMNVAGVEIFRALTAGDLSGGLDDGEAATIAHALTHSDAAVPVIDERKALRIFGAHWHTRTAIGTLALLTHTLVVTGLTEAELQDSLQSALVHARMRIPSHSRQWVIELIGPARASLCPSLGSTKGRSREVA